MKVVMMRQKSLESSIEKSDQNSVDGADQLPAFLLVAIVVVSGAILNTHLYLFLPLRNEAGSLFIIIIVLGAMTFVANNVWRNIPLGNIIRKNTEVAAAVVVALAVVEYNCQFGLKPFHLPYCVKKSLRQCSSLLVSIASKLISHYTSCIQYSE